MIHSAIADLTILILIKTTRVYHKNLLVFQSVYNAARFISRLTLLSRTAKPLSKDILCTKPYKHKPLRKLIDSATFNVYGHWVQSTDEQTRGALFEFFNKPHPHSTVSNRHRLLSGSQTDDDII